MKSPSIVDLHCSRAEFESRRECEQDLQEDDDAAKGVEALRERSHGGGPALSGKASYLNRT
jgi:hypothetical protein